MQVRAVVARIAPMDLVKLAKTANFMPKEFRSPLAGTPFEQFILARLGQLSPIDNIKPGASPFLLIHGTDDALVPFAQSRAMCDRMTAAGEAAICFQSKAADTASAGGKRRDRARRKLTNAR